jgi:hypothetical protein
MALPALGAIANATGIFDETRDSVVKTGPVIQNTPPPASVGTAGAASYTGAQFVGGIIVRNPNGSSRADVLPTAADMVATMSGPGIGGQANAARIGDTLWCLITNGSPFASNFTITVTAGAGGAIDPNQDATSAIIGPGTSKEIAIRLTNVTKGSEAYVFYC